MHVRVRVLLDCMHCALWGLPAKPVPHLVRRASHCLAVLTTGGGDGCV